MTYELGEIVLGICGVMVYPVARFRLRSTFSDRGLSEATDRFVEQVSRELQTQKFDLFHTHTLIKATAKDYVRETQVRLILQSITGRMDDLAQSVDASLTSIRQQADWGAGYAAGNLLNLLCQSQTTVPPFDFSQFTLRQPHLKGVQLHGFNSANTQ